MNNSSGHLFAALGQDPRIWLQQARQHKLAADALLPHLFEALREPQRNAGNIDRRFAFLHGYMLQIGFALENLIKAIEIARDPSLVTEEQITRGILGNHGHGITEGAGRHTRLSPDERELVRRVEEYLVWAGRYPLPLRYGTYAEAERDLYRSFSTDEPELLDALFERLVAVLQRTPREDTHIGAPPN